MASSNFVGGTTVSKSEPAKQEAISLEYHIVIGIDANSGTSFSKEQDVQKAYFSHGIENPNKETIPQCDELKEEFLYCNISENLKSETVLYEKIDSVIFLIQRNLNKYSIDRRYKKVYVRIYILGKGLDKLVTNIFHIIMAGGEKNTIKKKINCLLSSSTYLKGNIKKINVECIQCLEPTQSEQPDENKSDSLLNIHRSQGIDYQAGIFMCQYGYDSIKGDGNHKEKMKEKLKEYGGWRQLEKGDPKDIFSTEEPGLWKDMICSASGFYSQLFYTERNGKDIYAFCTAGTQMTSIKDWFSNFSQGLIGLAPQYTRSVQIARKLDKIIGNKGVLFFIGHSLGGGLASNNALVTQYRHAITYNAAGLNFMRVNATLLLNRGIKDGLFNVKGRRDRIHPFVIRGEILNTALGVLTLGSERAYGKDPQVIKLQMDKERSLLDKLNVPKTIFNSLKKHAATNFYELTSENGQYIIDMLGTYN